MPARPALSAERALAVIDLLASHAGERFTLTEIAQRTGVNPASTHAVLAALARSGYVERHGTHKTYGLGPAVVAAGEAGLGQLPAVREAKAELAALCADLDAEAVVTAATADQIVVVGAAGHRPFGDALRVGQRLPLAPPLGSVFLAWAGEAEVDAWLARARPPLAGPELATHRRILAATRRRGFFVGLATSAQQGLAAALAAQGGSIDELLAEMAHGPYPLEDVDEARSYDLSLVAAPVFGADGRVAAAISVSGLAPGLAAGDVVRIADRVRGAALLATKRAGGRVP